MGKWLWWGLGPPVSPDGASLQYSHIDTSSATNPEAGQTSLSPAARRHPAFQLRGQLSQTQIRKGFVLLPTAPVLQKVRQRLSVSQSLVRCPAHFLGPPPPTLCRLCPHTFQWVAAPDVGGSPYDLELWDRE